MSHLANAVTIVTGASSGIGAATAKRLAAAGARVVLAARNEDELTALVAEITEIPRTPMVAARQASRPIRARYNGTGRDGGVGG